MIWKISWVNGASVWTQEMERNKKPVSVHGHAFLRRSDSFAVEETTELQSSPDDQLEILVERSFSVAYIR